MSGRRYLLACGAVVVFAWVLNWWAGHRGIFLLDQSMIFDGGWRILQGEAPYRDFLMPFGPVPFYLQALFFRLFGVNWTATVLPACLLNALAAAAAMRITWILAGNRLLAWCAGLATAICFQAPFGTLWVEQTAMFFDLLALGAAAESLRPAARAWLWRMAAGGSLALAILSKQNFGVFFVPIVLAVASIGELPDLRRTIRAVLGVMAGLVAGLAVLAWAIREYSDLRAFVDNTVVLAAEIGRPRMKLRRMIEALTFSITLVPTQADLLGLLSGGFALLVTGGDLWSRGAGGRLWRQWAPAAAAIVLLPFFRSLTQATTENDWENNLAFLGIATCVGIGVFLRVFGLVALIPAEGAGPLRLPAGRTVKKVLVTAAAVWSAVVVLYVGRAVWLRSVQQFRSGVTFRETVRVPGMENVWWGEPTWEGAVQKRHFEAVYQYVASRPGAFFVMGDSTLFYGLAGKRSPQPLLYFCEQHSFLKRDIPRLDDRVVEALERNGVSTIIREKATFWGGVKEAYPKFPRLSRWFQAEFEPVADYGIYEIWRRRTASGPR